MGKQSDSALCARRLKVLADHSRLAVIENLMKRPSHVWELSNILKINQSLLSHHLKVLRREGLVEATRNGKAVLYSLAPGIEGYPSKRTLNLGCCRLSFK